jgi:hypothetical protein
MSNPDPRTQQAIADGEAAWLKVTSGNWDESAWRIMGTALILLRTEVLQGLGNKGNVARGSIYNSAFARRLYGTAFKSMDASTRSNLLFVMEPPNRIVLDRLMAEWTPDQRARRTHPATLARAIRAALRPPKPERQADEAMRNQSSAQAKTHEDVTRYKNEIAALNEEIATLKKPSADVARYEAEIAELRDENYKFRVELETQSHVIKTRNGGGLTSGQFRMLQKLGHPDDPLSEKKKNEAIRLINQLRYVLCNEAELPSMDPKKFSTWARQLWARRQKGIKEAKRYASRQRRGPPKPSSKPVKGLPRS